MRLVDEYFLLKVEIKHYRSTSLYIKLYYWLIVYKVPKAKAVFYRLILPPQMFNHKLILNILYSVSSTVQSFIIFYNIICLYCSRPGRTRYL